MQNICAMIGNAAVNTCGSWTSNGMGNAIVGHHDRLGGGNSSWNAAHMSNGCSQENLVATGGAGLFYCFAASPPPATPAPGRNE